MIADPSQTVLKAFIPGTEYLTDFDAPGGLDLSHWTALGTVRTTETPKPAAMMILGIGLVGLGAAARGARRIARR